MIQKRLNGVMTLRVHNSRTDDLCLKDVANELVRGLNTDELSSEDFCLMISHTFKILTNEWDKVKCKGRTRRSWLALVEFLKRKNWVSKTKSWI